MFVFLIELHRALGDCLWRSGVEVRGKRWGKFRWGEVGAWRRVGSGGKEVEARRLVKYGRAVGLHKEGGGGNLGWEESCASGGGEVRRGANRLHKEMLDEGPLISPFSTLHW